MNKNVKYPSLKESQVLTNSMLSEVKGGKADTVIKLQCAGGCKKCCKESNK